MAPKGLTITHARTTRGPCARHSHLYLLETPFAEPDAFFCLHRCIQNQVAVRTDIGFFLGGSIHESHIKPHVFVWSWRISVSLSLKTTELPVY